MVDEKTPREGDGLAKPKEMSEISYRIRDILDRYQDGNVTAAAKRLQVSPRGLAKVYHGQTAAPRADLLQAIVREYPVDPTWLLTGEEAAEWARSGERVRQEAERLLLELLGQLQKT